MMHGYWFGPMGWIGMIIGLVFWVLILGGLIWLVVWAVRRSGSGSAGSHLTSTQPPVLQSPKDIAQMRYARGEITREQYQQLLEDLNK